MKKLIITSLAVLMAAATYGQKEADNIDWLKQKMVKYGSIKYPAGIASTVSQFITNEGDNLTLQLRALTKGLTDSLVENTQYTVNLNRLEESNTYHAKDDQWLMLYFSPGTDKIISDQKGFKKSNSVLDLSLIWKAEDGLLIAFEEHIEALIKINQNKK